MKSFKNILLLALSLVFLPASAETTAEEKHVFKQVLKNGLTILVRPVQTTGEVALQLWYNVGSKHEKSGEKGLAHLIEHMIFKGTKLLSEVDIPLITHKLSGSCNAATSYDWTFYLFNVPRHNWKQVLPIMADCMCNCTFKEDLLASELKAVVQELKMRKDWYTNELIEKMITAIFPDHPYHYPVIGYKQDLWNLSRDALVNFYQQHYIPNNATLVIVGDVDPKDVFKEAEKHFGPIQPNFDYKKQEMYLNRDLEAKTVTMYRDIHQAEFMLAFTIPGRPENEFELELIVTSLVGGKESRLNKLLIDELQLANTVACDTEGFFDYDLFTINVEPSSVDNIDTIIEHIKKELTDLQIQGITKDEFDRALKKNKASFYSLMENNYKQAFAISKSFLETKNEEHVFIEHGDDYETANKLVMAFTKNYLRPAVMHKGFILPLPKEENQHWQTLQERSDQEDTRILSGRVRESKLEESKYAKTMKVNDVPEHSFPRPNRCTLSNGLEVFSYHNANVPKISLILELKANSDYEPEELPGLCNLLQYMLSEGGTTCFTAEQFAHELNTRSISVDIGDGAITMSMLSEDLKIALDLLYELVAHAQFAKEALPKVKAWALADYHKFITNPKSIQRKLIRETLYKNHPFSKTSICDEAGLANIKRKHLKEFYQTYFSPDGAKISVVGDLANYDVPQLLEETLGVWDGPAVADLDYPSLEAVKHSTVSHYMNRDQIYISFVGHSIDRFHQDFDKLLLFDQILGRGMNSILFKLREQSGAFYSINGSLIAESGKQPGLVSIATIVSQERLEEVKKLLSKTIKTAADSITQQEINEARTMLLNSYDNCYTRNHSIASTFLTLDRYNLPMDHFEKRHLVLNQITVDEIKQAVKKYLDLDKMMIFQVGRVGEQA